MIADDETIMFKPRTVYLSIAAWPVLAIWRNRLTPEVTVMQDQIEFRMLRRHRFAMADITGIDVDLGLGNRVVVSRRGSRWAYVASFPQLEGAYAMIDLLRRRGVPLNASARQLMERFA